jgi:hypothetical protein
MRPAGKGSRGEQDQPIMPRRPLPARSLDWDFRSALGSTDVLIGTKCSNDFS